MKPQDIATTACDPVAISVDALIGRTHFRSPLLQYTQQQWEVSIKGLEPIDEMPASAVRLVAWELAGQYGVVASPFVRCPPGCEPIGGRGEVCFDIEVPSVGEEVDALAYTPRPECWFEPQCWCGGEPKDLFGPAGKFAIGADDNCGNENCRFGFLPFLHETDDGLIVATRFGCSKIGGDCKSCTFAFTKNPFGQWTLGCICEC